MSYALHLCRPYPGWQDIFDYETGMHFYIAMLPVSRCHAPVRLMRLTGCGAMPRQGEQAWGCVLQTAETVQSQAQSSISPPKMLDDQIMH